MIAANLVGLVIWTDGILYDMVDQIAEGFKGNVIRIHSVFLEVF